MRRHYNARLKRAHWATKTGIGRGHVWLSRIREDFPQEDAFKSGLRDEGD